MRLPCCALLAKPAPVLCLLLCCALSACRVGPVYTPPHVAAPPAWGAEPAGNAGLVYGAAIDSAWWNSFHDAELTSLVTRLARQNLELKGAAERIEQARAERQIARSAGLPALNATASYTLTRQSKNGFLSLITPAPGAPLQYNFFADSITASWDLDLFGRIRRGVEAADANTEAATEARRTLALAMVAELAEDYVQLRGVIARESIAEETLQLADSSLALVRDQLANGVATNLEVADAEAQRATIASTLPGILTYKAGLINAIGLLLAEPPRALEAELGTAAPQPPTPPLVPVGLPGDLVRRRPDVRQAEAALHIATAETGVAVASFYPDISLAGDVGTQALKSRELFGLPSRAFDVGPTLSIPIFEGGRLRGTLNLRESQQREAALAFQRTVLGAWREADDSLTGYAQAQRERVEVARSVHQNELALAAARQAFQEGATDFLNVLVVQAALLQSRNALVNVDSEINTRLVGLYQALGGGWETIEAIR